MNDSERAVHQFLISLQIGEVVYEPILVRLSEGHVLLEAHADVYQRLAGLEPELRRTVTAAGVSDAVDWRLARRLVAEHDGRPHSIAGPDAKTTESRHLR